jgi:hypothetical protein
LFFLFKKIKKVFVLKNAKNGGLLRFLAAFEKNQKAEIFNSFFVKTE